MNAINDPEPIAAVSQSVASPRPPIAGKVLRLGAAVLVLAAAAVIGRWWFAEARYIETTDNAYIQGDIATLGARIDGDVAAVLVADNQAVKAGDPLIALDPKDWQARRDQAEAAVNEARANLFATRRQITQARAALGQNDAQIDQAQAELTRANADAGRSAALVGAGWTSRQANDQAVAAFRKAEAGFGLAVAQRAVSEQALAVVQSQAAVAEARVSNTEAQLRLGFVAPDGRPRAQPAAWRAAFACLTPPTTEAS